MNPIFKIFIVSLIVTSFFSAAYSQGETKTIIFTGSSSQKDKYTKKKNSEQNIIKISPTGVFVGQIPVIYERVLNDNISIQAAAGFTTKNYVRQLSNKRGNFENSIDETQYPWYNQLGSYSSDYASPIYDFTYRKPATGTFFSIQPKYYYNDDAPDGAYFAFSYSSSTYNFNHPKAALNGSNSIVFTGADQSEQEKIIDYMLHFGIQKMNKHFAIEYSTAIGLRSITGSKYAATTYNGKIYDGFLQYNKSTINYEMAIRIGYVF